MMVLDDLGTVDAVVVDETLKPIPSRMLNVGKRKIETVAGDIYEVLDSTKEHDPDTGLAAKYAMEIGGEFAKASIKRDRPREHGKLWASDLGKRCLRQHWYNFNAPQYGEKLDGHTKFKFLYGNILESAVLYYAEEAGHTVAHQQHTVEFNTAESWTIRGRIDAVLDGKLIDVKSTSSYGYKRYKEGIDPSNDSFGYIEQLAFYTHFNDITPRPDSGGFVWIDKQNGNICYTEVLLPDRQHIEHKASAIIEAVDKDEGQVAKHYPPEAYG
jgi:hypothetical protein